MPKTVPNETDDKPRAEAKFTWTMPRCGGRRRSQPSLMSPMFTLTYQNAQFTTPDTLLPFLQANVGKSPQIQIDCIMPYNGTAGQLMDEVCAYLSKLDRQIEVWPNVILNRSTERTSTGQSGSHLVFQIDVRSK